MASDQGLHCLPLIEQFLDMSTGNMRFVKKVCGLQIQLHFLLLKFHENWPKVKYRSRDFSDIISIIKIRQKAFIHVGIAT